MNPLEPLISSMIQIQQTYAIRVLQGCTLTEYEVLSYEQVCRCVEQYARMLQLNLRVSNNNLEAELDEESD